MRADRGFDHPHHCRHYDYLLSSYYVPDTDSPLNSPRVGHYCPCHTDEDTKAQRMISPRPWMEGAARLGGGTPLWTPCPEPFPPASGASWRAGLCRSVLLRFQAFPGLAWLPSPASSLLSCSEQLFERRWKRKRHLGPQAWSSPGLPAVWAVLAGAVAAPPPGTPKASVRHGPNLLPSKAPGSVSCKHGG